MGSEIMIGILVTVIIGMIALQISVGTITQKTDTRTTTDAQFTASNTSCVVIDKTDCIASITSIENATGGITWGSANYSICNTKNTGGVLFDGDTQADAEVVGKTNALNITYTGQDCLQITGMTSTLIKYTPILMALLLLIFVAGYIVMR